MLGDLDLKRIRDGLAGLELSLTLTFHASRKNITFSESLYEAACKIGEASSGVVRIKQGDGEGFPDLPALSLSYRGRGNIHYLALPEGPETPPFLEAMLDMPRGVARRDQEWVRKIASIRQPAELYVFMATTCPHCSQVVRATLQVSIACPQVTTYVIDAQQFQELADKYSVRSVPFTVLDRDLSTIGMISAPQLAEQICARDDQEYQSRVFQSLMQVGRIGDVSTRISRGESLDHFLSAWLRSSTSSRLGLMMVAERCLAENPRCLGMMVPSLVPALRSEDAAFRGDTADLLGQIGDPRAADELGNLLQDPNPDVVEIAEEALEKLRLR